jgi:hypothetical protein
VFGVLYVADVISRKKDEGDLTVVRQASEEESMSHTRMFE